MLLCLTSHFMAGKHWEAIIQNKPDWPCNNYSTSQDMRQSSHPGLKQMNWEIQAAELNFNRVISHDIKDPNTSATGELLLLMEYFSKTVFPISGPRDPPRPSRSPVLLSNQRLINT